MRHKNKHLDFEINLIPCIDLLSVCICFLLLTAVWLQVGSLNVKQAIGGQSSAETEKKSQLWVTMLDKGELVFNIKESAKISGRNATMKTSVTDMTKTIESLKQMIRR